MAEPRTVLTTGANSGIGLATLIAVAKAGFDSVGSVRSAAKARQVRSAAAAAGWRCAPCSWTSANRRPARA